MRFFDLLANLHIYMYLFPGLLFIIIFGLLLGYVHFHSQKDEERIKKTIHQFPGGIEGRNAPLPLGMAVIIIGTIAWGFFYILFYGLYKVAI